MINLLILGNGKPVKQVIESLNKNDFKIINVEQDKILTIQEQIDFDDYLRLNGIVLNKLNELKIFRFDLILSVNYNKIIYVEQFPDMKILNLHIGLLPKYRGNSANAWAVINGEDEVGYSLHEVTNILDGGKIFYRYAYNITGDESYLKGKNAIDLDINKNLNNTLISIFNNSIKPISQEGLSFIYCTKLRPSDGIIDNWNVSSDLLIRKSYVFRKPLGTGLRFKVKDVIYDIDKVVSIKEFDHSIGIPGSVVYISDNKLWIKTGDTAVVLSGISQNRSLIDVNKIFKIGMRF